MKEQQNNFIPEDHFPDVPASFSAESEITAVESKAISNGIIFGDLKEVEIALRAFNGEVTPAPPSAMTATLDLARDVLDTAGPLGAGIVALASDTLMKRKDFVGTMIAEARCHLATKGRYHRSYDYDALGSSFFKTTVGITKVDDKFVLKFGGGAAESELSTMMGKDIALSMIDINVSMGTVDGWWYNLNLEKTLGRLELLKSNTEDIWHQAAQALADGERQFQIEAQRDGVIVDVVISVEYNRYRYGATDHEGHEEKVLTKASGTNISGAAWNAYRRRRDEASPEPKKLRIVVKHHGTGYNSLPVTDVAKTEALSLMANEIAEGLRKLCVCE